VKHPIAALAPFALAVTVLATAAAQTPRPLPAETLLDREILRRRCRIAARRCCV